VRLVAGADDHIQRVQREAIDQRASLQHRGCVRARMHMTRLDGICGLIDEPHRKIFLGIMPVGFRAIFPAAEADSFHPLQVGSMDDVTAGFGDHEVESRW